MLPLDAPFDKSIFNHAGGPFLLDWTEPCCQTL